MLAFLLAFSILVRIFICIYNALERIFDAAPGTTSPTQKMTGLGASTLCAARALLFVMRC